MGSFFIWRGVICGALWCFVVLCGALWCFVVLCGALWCFVVLCGVLYCVSFHKHLSVHFNFFIIFI
jgi:hypothetical protein